MTQEFDAKQSDWTDIAAALQHHGVVLVHNGYDPTLLTALRQEADAEYRRRDALDAEGQLPGNLKDYHLRFRAIGVQEITLQGHQTQQFLVTPMIAAIATLILRKPPEVAFSSYRCARVDHANLVIPYHQDSRIIASLAPQAGPLPQLINLWVPLQVCGRDSPGLEVVNSPVTGLMVTQTSDQNFYSSIGTEISHDLVAQTFTADQFWRPAFVPGDFLLFKGTMVHRTYTTPVMTAERISVDIRLL
jgi:hypothetical protein